MTDYFETYERTDGLAHCTLIFFFLGASTYWRKAPIVFVLSVHLSFIRIYQVASQWVDFREI
jgi:hypothetical protein